MPFVEVTTSAQDGMYGADGSFRSSRTFTVWGVTPQTFWLAYRSIPCADTAHPANQMPEYGDTMIVTNGPTFPGTEQGTGVPITVYMHEYTMQPISAVAFRVVAHYTNDPRQTPNGIGYTSTQQLTFVPIPYVRELIVVAAGTSSGTAAIAYDEAVYQAPMSMERITHSVSLPRSQLKAVETAISQQAGGLHQLPIKQWACKFEGGDVTLQGVQRLDVRYHWTWEGGVPPYTVAMWGTALDEHGSPAGADIRQITPPNQPASSVIAGTNGQTFLVPPYTTIEMAWDHAGSVYEKKPIWLYRVPLLLGSGSFNPTWMGLPGSEKFIWN